MKSDAEIVIQWSIYLQEFMVFLRHIAGEYNISDWGTYMYMLVNKTAWYADQVEQFLPILSCFQSHREQRVYRSHTVYGW